MPQRILALPQNPSVESGSVSFESPDQSTLNIHASDQAVINFSSFDIAANETVQIFQPSAQATLLNRIQNAASATNIFGNLFANGIVFLVNPQGINFGPAANIQAAGFVASTLDISTQNFLDKQYIFEHELQNTYAKIVNQGRIAADNIALIASSVENAPQGLLVAQAGTVALASGDKVTVSFDSNNLINVAINTETSGKESESIVSAVTQAGTIEAKTVVMTAKTASDLFEQAVNHTGITRATGMIEENGTIRIVANRKVKVSGTLEAKNGNISIESEEQISLPTTLTTDAQQTTLIAPSIIGGTIQASNLMLQAISINLTTTAQDLTYYLRNADNMHLTSSTLQDGLVTLEGEGVFVVYPVITDLTLQSNNTITTEPGVILQANTIKLISNKFGTTATPITILADYTYIQRLSGNIDIAYSQIFGDQVLVRGPPDGFGAIIYSHATNLTLDAQKVTLQGTNPTYLYGNITFSNFECTIPDKEIYFEAGKTYTILGAFKTQGSYGQHVRLLSSQQGTQWYIDPQGTRDITYTWVEDSYNLNHAEIILTESTNRGNSYNWDPTGTWTGAVNNSWANAGNWTGLGGAIPGSGDDVLFDSGSVASTIDQAFTIKSLTIASGYTGTITQNGNLTITGNFNMTGGIFTCTLPQTYSFSVGNSFSIPGAAGSFKRYTGLGTALNPYLIYDVYGLQAMKNYLSSFFKLANNVNAAATVNWNAGGGFEPVGDDVNPFTGTLDGQNHTITGLFINRTADTDYVGLFYYIDGATVQNLGLVNVNITGGSYAAGLAAVVASGSISNVYVTGQVASNGAAGGLVGDGAATVTGCHSLANVSGTDYVGGLVASQYADITNSYATGAVTGGNYVGGLIGNILLFSGSATISGCYATGDVTATLDNVGGLIGNAQCSSGSVNIVDSYATGDVVGRDSVGGLVGLNSKTNISNSYATGSVTGNNWVGGLIGNLFGGMMGGASITNSYATGAVTGVLGVGGFAGIASTNTSISQSYATGAVIGTDYVGGLVGSAHGNAFSSVSITDAYAKGSVTGTTDVGGLVGYSYAEKVNPIDIGNVNITNAYAIGAVSGSTNVGGLVGFNSASTFTANYWDTQTSGMSNGVQGGNVSGVTGKTTAQMMTQSTYSVWNFGSIWNIIEGTSYPYHQWRYLLTPQVISGIAYSDQGSTPISSGATVAFVLNGSSLGFISIGSNGFYCFLADAGTFSDGDALLLYLNNHPTAQGNVVTRTSTSNISNLDIYGNSTVIVRHENAGPITNATLSAARGSLSDTDILYSVAGSDLAFSSGANLFIWTGKTFAPGGNITISGNWTNNGTFTPGSNTVTFNGSGIQTLKSAGSSFYNIVYSGAGILQLVDPTLSASGIIGTLSNPVSITATGIATLYASGMQQNVSIAISGSGSFSFPGPIPGFVFINGQLQGFVGQETLRSQIVQAESMLYKMMPIQFLSMPLFASLWQNASVAFFMPSSMPASDSVWKNVYLIVMPKDNSGAIQATPLAINSKEASKIFENAVNQENFAKANILIYENGIFRMIN